MSDSKKFCELFSKLNDIAKQFHQIYKTEYGLGEISIDINRGLFYFYLDKDPIYKNRWTSDQKYMRIGLPLQLLDKDPSNVYRYLFDKAVSLTENEE